MKWYEKPEVLSYIVDAYAGVDGQKRQFIWEDGDDVVIGNSRAFADHLAERFKLDLSDKAWMAVHEAMRALGEVVQVHAKHSAKRGGRFVNQQPEYHVIRRKGDR